MLPHHRGDLLALRSKKPRIIKVEGNIQLVMYAIKVNLMDTPKYNRACFTVKGNPLFVTMFLTLEYESHNLQYNTLVQWLAGTNESLTKGLMFQAL